MKKILCIGGCADGNIIADQGPVARVKTFTQPNFDPSDPVFITPHSNVGHIATYLKHSIHTKQKSFEFYAIDKMSQTEALEMLFENYRSAS